MKVDGGFIGEFDGWFLGWFEKVEGGDHSGVSENAEKDEDNDGRHENLIRYINGDVFDELPDDECKKHIVFIADL